MLTLSGTDTFETGTTSPSLGDVRLIESRLKGVKKSRKKLALQVSVFTRGLSYRGVNAIRKR